MVKRTRNIYNPKSEQPFKLSRSKVDNFVSCPRCFYIDRRLGVGHPPGFPFNINSAVDELLKKEFDQYREKGVPHPYMESIDRSLIPFKHEKLDMWRENFKGVQYHHKETNLIFTGAVDDLWIDTDSNEVVVVDYKATSKNSEVTIDADWQQGYRRQMDFYQWLLRKNKLDVSDIGYFVYCNGDKQRTAFENKVHFKVSVLEYRGEESWIESTIGEIKKLLNQHNIPDFTENCKYCTYTQDIISIS
jgi:CRISPR/Cas system-associated exonuclease Cas4 (RecB family)|tara:strand:+ start:192 stop:929 length:738 start_codon:yes stop_codon:yes gene_type:complete